VLRSPELEGPSRSTLIGIDDGIQCLRAVAHVAAAHGDRGDLQVLDLGDGESMTTGPASVTNSVQRSHTARPYFG
jgi:hypothetical protein